MPQFQTWEEFSRAAEKLYLADPMRVSGLRPRLLLEWFQKCEFDCYNRLKTFSGSSSVKCLVYRTDQAQDVKKIEKFHSQLMRLMVAKESRSVAMETD
ncbi:PREDICTED: signal recognition particle 9 kDa protein [Myotis davidii]|uniref:signal recognition particle 9 kDa protein n=1 Tax=Myotis davidii TaxID=225400 RepID=UPI0003EBC73F|nr:PREDICTED: signal recognition particle 9 kDa protein [Myotis davidii]